MRALFLDFDGTLHPVPTGKGSTPVFCWLEHITHALAEHPDVVLVVHSSWREKFSPSDISEFLSDVPNPYGGTTEGPDRLASIEKWLADHPEVLSHRILDDDPASFGKHVPHELIQCPPDLGVSCPKVRHQLTLWLERTAHLVEPLRVARAKWVR